MLQTNHKQFLRKLKKNYNTLKLREARFAANPPLDLLNQIEDHEQAIALTQQVIDSELSNAEWQEALKPLLLAVNNGQVVNIQAETYIARDVKGDVVSGDQIDLGNIAQQTAVAVGRGARAQVRVFNIGIQLLPVVVILLAIIGTLAYLLFRPTTPETMNAEFNVAVAEFSVVDENGVPLNSDDGQALADFLARRLETSFTELELGHSYEIWPPAYTGRIDGRSQAEREEAAEALTDKIKAHIIIYGVITQAADRSQFTPEFYVNSKGFEEGAEIIGQHELGSPLRVTLPFEATQLQAVENPALSARTEALGLITIGLAYYSIDDFQQALTYFERAEATPGWFDNAGKELIYLLLGNATVRLVSKEKSDQHLPAALAHYEQALAINGEFTRAKVGQAGTLYLMALGDLTDPSFETVNKEQLDQAAAEFEQALSLGNPPASANIEAKVNFGLGQIDFVRAQLGDNDGLAQAEARFNQVVQEYEQGNVRIAELAGHAFARLALLARLQGQVEAAAVNYRQATGLVTPYYQGYYQAQLGELYAGAGQIDQAIEAYDEAVKIAEQFGDEVGMAAYSKRLDELRE